MAEKLESPATETPSPYACFVNRELSWLEFNRRVLMEAADPAAPLLERLKFLGIYESNLEEFFMVRVGILTHRAQMLPDQPDPRSGWPPKEQIRRILEVVREQQTIAERIWRALTEALTAAGVDVVDFRRVSKVDELMCKKIFSDMRPMLFPRVISDSSPAPFLWGKESYVVAWLGRSGGSDLAIVPLTNIPRYTAFEIDGRQKIVLTDQLVRHFLPLLFKKTNIRESAIIRVTRNADVFLSDKLTDENFRVEMSAMLKKRKRQQPVRLQIAGGKLSAAARNYLVKSLRIPEQSVFATTVPFDLSFRGSVKSAPGFKYEERRSSRDIGLKKGEYFAYIEKNDLLLALPFQNMMPFVDLLYEAADDPTVESIRITLYRLAANSKVAAALAYAADRGKDVLALLELRARFDEQNNIDYSEVLEDAGCTVIYGLPDKKVHCKLCLITRRTPEGVRHITQIGTGNYNEVTGDQYCDLSLMTASEAAAADAEAVFDALEVGRVPPPAETLWVAPLSFKQPLMALLDREIAKGEKGRVRIKVNSINHREIMRKLIECSRAGVKVELYVRGICCLRPGVSGETENISVKSIVGRWLEHARIYSFGEGDDERIFIGSGDLLNRNVERRVEVFAEVTSPDTKAQVRRILDAEEADRSKGWLMQSDGHYVLDPGPEDSSSQEALYRYFHGRTVSSAPPAPLTPSAPFATVSARPAPAVQHATVSARPAQSSPASASSAKKRKRSFFRLFKK
ncbi:MAG: polyphosphate kinase 1 [Oscillospiraceae bacterium]|nr:polyphosphate kinase 1 [Oscillospiraceae bacterium]